MSTETNPDYQPLVFVRGNCNDCPFEHYTGQASDQPFCWAHPTGRDLPDIRHPAPEWCPLRAGAVMVQITRPSDGE